MGFCFIAVAVTGLLTINIFQNNREIALQRLQNEGRELVVSFDHALKVQEVTLEILGAEAQSILDGQKYIIRGTIVDLVPTDNPQGFTLMLPRGRTEEQVGNLTGLGSIPDAATPRAMEIAMALGLSPLFEQTIKNNDALPWVYYTSASRFIYAYPRVSPETLFFSDALLEKEFFTIATPENNPARELVWSPLYEDSAGAGLIVTVSKPIYNEDQFLGVLSIDVGISSLKWLLERSSARNACAYLVDPDGQTIVGLGAAEINIDIDAVIPEHPIKAGDNTLMVFPLDEVDWYVVLDIDDRAFSLSVLNATSTVGLVFVFVVFSVALILLTTFYMRLARYMAFHDNLTGLFNRRAFDELAFADVEKNATFELHKALAVVDIDFFKKYNDCYGHVSGDDTLRRVANSLVNSLRSPMDKIYRVGGEEFAIVLLVKTTDDLTQILARLVEEVDNLGIPHELSPFKHITVSVGAVVASISSKKGLEEAYNHADRILYQAKEAGRNRWMIQ
jgi:diguanylate cyclase (GGDEF)-like protein